VPFEPAPRYCDRHVVVGRGGPDLTACRLAGILRSAVSSSSAIQSLLTEAIADGDYVAIERTFPGEPRLCGYVEAMSDALVAVQPFHDFYPEGWAVIRREDIEEVDCGERENVIGAMLHAEGLERRQHPFPLELASFGALLRQMHAHDCPVIIECEDADEDEDTFELGRIDAIDDLRVHIRLLDVLGRWKEVVSIPLRDVTKVQIDNPYLRTFVKYAEPMKKNE
jgi:hypothetical protein